MSTADGVVWRAFSKPELARHIRRALPLQIIDDSGAVPTAVAIYSLSDPRDLRAIRYVGQTGSPQRRFQQHLSTARLWLPDDIPWWVCPGPLRPLYTWIRGLHRDGYRLPMMVISAWIVEPVQALGMERARIHECLQNGHVLFNVESGLLRPQMLLELEQPAPISAPRITVG
jgi:hypothetical protein